MAFRGFLRTCYPQANVAEVTALQLVGVLDSPMQMLVIDVQCMDSSTLHRLPQQLSANQPAAADITLVAVIKNIDDLLTESLMLAGFNGVIVKSQPPSQITQSLQLLAEGMNCRPAPSAATDRVTPLTLPENLQQQLSDQEQAMLSRLMAGTSIQALAREFEISEKECIKLARHITGILRGQTTTNH